MSFLNIDRPQFPINPHTFTIDRKLQAQVEECGRMTEAAIRKALEYIIPIASQ